MKTPTTAIVTGLALCVASLLLGPKIDVAFCAIFLFGTGLVAWTIEQYGRHGPQ